MSEFVTTCEAAARAGGKVLLDWMGRFKVREKGPADLVTEADEASQEAIARILMSTYPDHGFLGEEGATPTNEAAEYCWIVDPLDGTTNYVHGAPQFSVSVALTRQGEVICGTVFDPLAKECFTAASGEGARLNGDLIHVSEIGDLERALVAASLPAQVRRDSPEVEQFLAVLTRCQALRRMGSAALNFCWIASGRLDAYWATSTKAWDIAAGVLIVREAGGVVTAPDGGPLALLSGQFAAAATESLHKELVRLIG